MSRRPRTPAFLCGLAPTAEDQSALTDLLTTYNAPMPAAFKKIVSGRTLWNFDRKALEICKAAL